MRRILAFLLFLSIGFPAFAAEVEDPAGKKPYLSWFYDDAASMLSSPSRGDAEYWGKAGAALAVTAALYVNDGKIRDWFAGRHSPALDDLSAAGELMGSARFLLPAMGLAWAGGWAFESDYTVETVKLAFEAAVLSQIGVQAIKLSGHRHRPPDGDGPYVWDGPDYLHPGDDSFPSGHSAAAFSVASVLAARYGADAWWAAPLIYSTALITPLSRVYDDKHWASDAFAGAAIGYFIGNAVARYHSEDAKVTICPQLTENGPALAVSADF